MYKPDLTLNNLRLFICHKPKQNQSKSVVYLIPKRPYRRRVVVKFNLQRFMPFIRSVNKDNSTTGV